MKLKLRFCILAIVLMQSVSLWAYETVSGVNTSNQTWTTGNTYFVENNISFEDARLTIEPGVVVKFADDVMFILGFCDFLECWPGELVVNGTADERVVFTSMHDNTVGETIAGSSGNPSNADWIGFWIQGGSEFDIEYADFRYAKGTNGDLSDFYGAIWANDADPSTISNCTFTHLMRGAIVEIFSNSNIMADNLFIDHAEYGLAFEDGNLDNYTNITFGNDVRRIAVSESSFVSDISGWTATNPLSYISFYGWIKNNSVLHSIPNVVFHVRFGCLTENLTIEEEVIVKFESNSGLEVREGTLNINGTSINPVILTSWDDDRFGGDTNDDGNATTPKAGRWRGIIVTEGCAVNLYHTNILFAGDKLNYSDIPAAVQLLDLDEEICVFEDCRFENSKGYGVYSINARPKFKSCSFINNMMSSFYIDGRATIDYGSNIFRNNDVENGIEIINAGSYALSATDIDWGTTEETGIAAKLQNTGSGSITYDPYYKKETGDIFYSITPDTVATRPLSNAIIPAADIAPGAVISYQTGEGHYGKFMIVDYLFNDTYFWWETWEGDSTISAGTRLKRRNNVAFDLDFGIGLTFFPSDFVIDNYGDLIPLGGTTCFLETPPPCTYTTHSGTIYDSVTWGAGTHLIESSFMVYSDATLNILPGAVIKFGENAKLSVLGNLFANGTPEEPIIFTSSNDNSYGCEMENSNGSPQPGDWKFIESHGFAGPVVEMNHCTVRYGGSETAAAAFGKATGFVKNSTFEYSATSGLKSADYGDLDIQNSIFSNNGNHGLEYGYYAKPRFKDCSFTDNAGHAVDVTSGIFVQGLLDNTGTGNSINGIVINSIVSGYEHYLHNDAANTLTELPFVILSPITLYEGMLDIKEGTVIKFGENGSLTSYNSNAMIKARYARFTSLKDDDYAGDTNNDGDATQPAPGDWKGIDFRFNENGIDFFNSWIHYAGKNNNPALSFSNGAGGLFDRSRIYHSADEAIYLGGGNIVINDCYLAQNNGVGIFCATWDSVTINDCHIVESGSHAIEIFNSSPAITNNYISENGGYPVYVNYGIINKPFTGNQTVDNLMEGIAISSLNYSVKNTFYAAPQPYIILNSLNSYDDDTLQFMPGTIVKFMPGKELNTRGAIIADSAVFTSIYNDTHGGDTNNDGDATTPAPGDWAGLEANYSNGRIELDDCTLTYGGHGNSYYLVYLGSGANGFVKNSTLQHSLRDGIGQSAGGELEVSGNTIAQCVRYGLDINGVNNLLVSNNLLTENGSHAIQSTNSNISITGNHFENNAGYPVYFSSGCIINSPFTGNTSQGNLMEGFAVNGLSTDHHQQLHPEAGMPYIFTKNYTCYNNDTLEFMPGTVVKFLPGIELDTRGKIIANGTVFTSVYDDTYDGDTNNDGDATTPAPGDWAGLEANYADGRIELDGCTLRYGGSSGTNALVLLGSGAGGFVKNSTLEFSLKEGVYTGSCQNVEISGNTFNANQRHAIHDQSSSHTLISGNQFLNTGSHAVNVANSNPQFTGNHFENNAGYPVYFSTGCIINSPFTGNTSQGNLMEGFAVNGLSTDHHQQLHPGAGMPYIFTGNYTCYNNDTLEFMPGTVVKFLPVKELDTRGKIIANGAVFTSVYDDTYDGDTNNDGDATTPAPGDWAGLEANYADGRIELDGCTLRYGGSSTNALVLLGSGAGGWVKNSTLEFSSKEAVYTGSCQNFEISDNTFNANQRHAIHDHSSSHTLISGNQFLNTGSHAVNVANSNPQFTGNHFENNAGYPVYFSSGCIISSPFTGNTSQGNLMEGFAVNGLSTDYNNTFYPNAGMPFIILTSQNLTNLTTNTFMPGTVVKFSDNAHFRFRGAVIANEVTFTSIHDDSVDGDTNNNSDDTTPAAGSWGGLHPEYGDASLELTNCFINWAGQNGQGAIYAFSGPVGNLDQVTIQNANSHGIYWYGGTINIQNSEISNSQSSGIFLTGTVQASLTGNTIFNNGQYGIYANAPSGLTMRSNQVTGNTLYGLYSFGTYENAIDLGQNNPDDQGLNSFSGNDNGNFQIYNDGSNTINAYYNLWDWHTAAEIDDHIYDDDENAQLGKVFFEPWHGGETINAPEIVSVSQSPGEAELIISWLDLSGNETGFQIRRLLNGSFEEFEVAADVTSFADNSVEYFENYGYTVRAFNEGGVSNWSDTLFGICLPLPEMTITLPEGWSGLSGNLNPPDPDIENLFAPIANNMIILQNESGFYWPGQNINTLTNWSCHSGYAIKMDQQRDFVLAGNEEQDRTVNLQSGWNLIPVIANQSVSLESIFDGVNITLVKEVAGWRVHWPEFGIHTLTSLERGNAYYVNCPTPGTIHFGNSQKSASSNSIKSDAFATLAGWDTVIETPFTHTIAFPETFGLLQEGDLIGAFTAERVCAGIATVTDGKAAIMVNGDDKLTDVVEGLSEGEKIRFKVSRPSTGETFGLDVSFENRFDNTGLFHSNAISVVASLQVTALENATSTEWISVFPNPTTGKIFIEGLIAGSDFSVFDAFGNEVLKTGRFSNGAFDLSDQAKGVYILRIYNQNRHHVSKVILH